MCSLGEIKAIIDDSLRPFVGRLKDVEDTVFGDDWAGGLKGWANRQNGYLKGIRLVLVIVLPILTTINAVVLTMIILHIVRGG